MTIPFWWYFRWPDNPRYEGHRLGIVTSNSTKSETPSHRSGRGIREVLLVGIVGVAEMNKRSPVGQQLKDLRARRLAENRRRREARLGGKHSGNTGNVSLVI